VVFLCNRGIGELRERPNTFIGKDMASRRSILLVAVEVLSPDNVAAKRDAP